MIPHSLDGEGYRRNALTRQSPGNIAFFTHEDEREMIGTPASEATRAEKQEPTVAKRAKHARRREAALVEPERRRREGEGLRGDPIAERLGGYIPKNREAIIVCNGRGERIRTFDPLVPNQVR